MLQIEGVTILSFYPDWMHCKSLGIDKPLLGSVLYVLVHYILPGGVEDNLSAVWRDIESFYDELSSENRYGHMRQTMFHTKSQPKLKGKAAEVKDLCPVLVLVWQKYMNPLLPIHQKILVVLKGSYKSLRVFICYIVFRVLCFGMMVVDCRLAGKIIA